MSIDEDIKRIEEEGVKEKSKITGLEIATAEEFFGDAARYPDRPLLRITCENQATLNTSARGLELDSNGELSIVNKVQFQRGIKNALSKLGMFLKKYGEAPKVGMTVSTVMNDDGYMRIEV
jgi:hypothetical protein